MLGRRIAVVEDDAANAGFLVEFGQEFGAQVDLYGVLNDEMLGLAFQQIKQIQPNIAIIDVNLGDASGYRLLDLLNTDPTTRWIWKIVVTGDAYGKKRREALRVHHADDLVEKPYDIKDLGEAIVHGFERVDQIMSDPTTGIPGIEQTERILPHVFRLEVPYCCISTDWNGYGNLIYTLGPQEAEETLREVVARHRQIIAGEDPRYSFFGQMGKTDGAILICRAENALPYIKQMMESFREVVHQRILKSKGGRKILERGFAIREMVEEGRDGRPIKLQRKLPVPTLAVGVNPSVWFKGHLSFSVDDSLAWQAEPVLNAPREMFYPRMVRRLSDIAREEAERLGKSFERSWVVVHNQNPWVYLSLQEQQEQETWRQERKKTKREEST